MIRIEEAIEALGVNNFQLTGIPSNETEFNSMFIKLMGKNDDGETIKSTDISDFGCTWTEVDAKWTELKNGESIKELRAERNAKLAETDWEIVKHKELGTNIPAALKTYRQALRDITDTYTSLDDVVWPEKP